MRFPILHWLLVLPVLVIACLPIILARARHVRHAWWIIGLNLVLGWTGIGWVAALVWALCDAQDRHTSTADLPPSPYNGR